MFTWKALAFVLACHLATTAALVCNCDGPSVDAISLTPCSNGRCEVVVSQANVDKYIKTIPPGGTYSLADFNPMCYLQNSTDVSTTFRHCTLQLKMVAGAFGTCPDTKEVVTGIKQCYCNNKDLCNGNPSNDAQGPLATFGHVVAALVALLTLAGLNKRA